MDVIRRENVNVANTIIADSLTLTETYQDLEAWLLRFGSISFNFLNDDPNSEFHHHAIIKCTYSSAMKALKPLLPVTMVSMLNPDPAFNVCALSSVYHQVASDSATKGYLEELQAVANASGKSIEEVLQEELKKMESGHSLAEPLPASGERFESTNVADSQMPDSTSSLDGPSSPTKSQRVTTEHAAPPSSENSPFRGNESKKSQNLSKKRPNSRTSSPAATVLPHPDLTIDMIDPPSMQKVAVEHIVRTNDTALQLFTPAACRVKYNCKKRQHF